jgi:hypothetical protein
MNMDKAIILALLLGFSSASGAAFVVNARQKEA